MSDAHNQDESVLRRRGGQKQPEPTSSRPIFRTTNETAAGNRSDFIPEQFAVRPPEAPLRSIALGCFLFVVGSCAMITLLHDFFEYATTEEADVVALIRKAKGVFGEKVDEEETDEEVGGKL